MDGEAIPVRTAQASFPAGNRLLRTGTPQRARLLALSGLPAGNRARVREPGEGGDAHEHGRRHVS